jgi:putative selenate reductase FAD-binding subunit
VLQFKNYARPETVEEAYELIRKGRMNRVLGGGCWLRMQTRRIATMIDLSACGLDQIEEDEECFRIGAMVTLHQLESHERFNEATCHVFEHAVRDIVGVQFRNLATMGGSVYGRFGYSDVLTSLLALDTEVELVGAGIVSLASFRNMPYERDILTHVIVHKHDYQASFSAVRRQATDFPVLNVCAARWDGGWHVTVGARPTKAKLVEGERLGLPENFTEAELEAACERLSELPMSSNMRGSERYRRHLARELGKRTIRTAAGLEPAELTPLEPAPRPVCAGELDEAEAAAGEAAERHAAGEGAKDGAAPAKPKKGGEA